MTKTKTKNYKKLAITLAKTIAKQRANYICEKCYRSRQQGWAMHGAHIMPVTYAATAADPHNIICLCASCHSMGPKSSHQNPIDFGRWFDEKYPGRYDSLRHKALAHAKNTARINWQKIYEDLKEDRTLLDKYELDWEDF